MHGARECLAITEISRLDIPPDVNRHGKWRHPQHAGQKMVWQRDVIRPVGSSLAVPYRDRHDGSLEAACQIEEARMKRPGEAPSPRRRFLKDHDAQLAYVTHQSSSSGRACVWVRAVDEDGPDSLRRSTDQRPCRNVGAAHEAGSQDAREDGNIQIAAMVRDVDSRGGARCPMHANIEAEPSPATTAPLLEDADSALGRMPPQ